MNGLSAMKRTASTSSSIFAVSSATTDLSAKQVIQFSYSPLLARRGKGWGSNGRASNLSPDQTTPLPTLPHKGGVDHLPSDGFAAAVDQRALVGPGNFDFFRRGPRRLFQRDGVLVRGQPIMPGTIE